MDNNIPTQAQPPKSSKGRNIWLIVGVITVAALVIIFLAKLYTDSI